MPFLSLLRKFPQITSLSFVYEPIHTPNDSTLGHLVGELPTSIKFLTFDAALCSEALQLLCVILIERFRVHNPSESSSYWQDTEAETGKNSTLPTTHGAMPGSSASADIGLQGLAIRWHNFAQNEASDVNYILELLDPRNQIASKDRSRLSEKGPLFRSFSIYLLTYLFLLRT